MRAMTLQALLGLPEIKPGDDLAQLIGDALLQNDLRPEANDILIVAQKVVSKAEDRLVDLASITPGPHARARAAATGKDQRLVELILSQSSEIIRTARNVLIVRHRLGYVMANAGIDRSNVPGADDRELVLLLPADPEGSARALRTRLTERFGVDLAVVISDSFGRPWRVGTLNVALAAAGLPALYDRRGQMDRQGRVLEMTQVAVADAVAAAAGLVMGEGAEGTPVVLLRGFECDAPLCDATSLIRPVSEDLFR
ncbi:MAG: coenzyme F420-0:L-glutamate ligase [Pseudomonadota bacterium]|nr:coenzyme F420-0:L-glutamate ligase [Pseudomonadota bacterium]